MESISRNSFCPEFIFSATQNNNANFQLTQKSSAILEKAEAFIKLLLMLLVHCYPTNS